MGRVLIFLDMVTGLRRGEPARLKWAYIDFLNLQINVSRSVVDQHVGKYKTEVSQKPVPIDEYIAATFWNDTATPRTMLRPIGFPRLTATGRVGSGASNRFGCAR